MKLNPYLLFDGACEQAFKFYVETLGAKVDALMRFDQAPKQPGAPECQTPPGFADKVLHGRIVIGGEVLMASDAPTGHYEKPQGIRLTLNVDKPAEADRLFQTLAEGGSVQMPIAKTFFAERFGMLTDRFGIPWMVSCEAVAA